jgi:hypothetical protein
LQQKEGTLLARASVAAQVAPLWRVRAVRAQCKLKTASLYSKGRANGSRPRAAIQRLLRMTWTPPPAWRMSRWQHATPGAAAAARPRHKHVCAGCPRRSMCRQRGRRVNARKFICTSLARCATTAQLWNRWPDVRAMCPAPTSVARRPSLYREQSPDDRRPHGLAHNRDITSRLVPTL